MNWINRKVINIRYGTLLNCLVNWNTSVFSSTECRNHESFTSLTTLNKLLGASDGHIRLLTVQETQTPIISYTTQTISTVTKCSNGNQRQKVSQTEFAYRRLYHLSGFNNTQRNAFPSNSTGNPRTLNAASWAALNVKRNIT